MGLVQTAGAASGRRIYVDGVVVGQTPEAVKVKCGLHNVKVGSSGKARSVEVPCGGAVSVVN
jgi:serine/threonine-protein kinase